MTASPDTSRGAGTVTDDAFSARRQSAERPAVAAGGQSGRPEISNRSAADGKSGAYNGLTESSRLLLSKGELLYLHGDPAANSFLIEGGLVALALAARPGRERIIGLAGPGDLVGAYGADQGYYLDSATALSHEVSLLSFPADERFEASDAVGDLLRGAALRHLERLTNQLEDTEVPVPARVARTFLRLAERFGQANDYGAIRLTLPLTHETLAAMVGAARETTSSTVEQLRKLELVTGTRGRYIVQRGPLQEFAAQAAQV